jgi:hypothetical protein
MNVRKNVALFAAVCAAAAFGGCALRNASLIRKAGGGLDYAFGELFGAESGVKAYGESFGERPLTAEEAAQARSALALHQEWELLGTGLFDEKKGRWEWEGKAMEPVDARRSAMLFSSGCPYSLQVDFSKSLAYVRSQTGASAASAVSEIATYAMSEKSDLALKRALKRHIGLDRAQEEQVTEDVGYCLRSLFSSKSGVRMSVGGQKGAYFLSQEQASEFFKAMDYPVWVMERAGEEASFGRSAAAGAPSSARFWFRDNYIDYQLEADWGSGEAVVFCYINSSSPNYMGEDTSRSAAYAMDEASRMRIGQLAAAFISAHTPR